MNELTGSFGAYEKHLEEQKIALESAVASRMATLATFDPRSFNQPETTTVLRTLANPIDDAFSQVGASENENHWYINENWRIEIIASVLRRGGIQELQKVRDSVHDAAPTALQRLLDEAIAQQFSNVDELSIEELDAAVQVRRWMSSAAARAGASSSIALGPSEEELEGRINLLQLLEPFDALLLNGCVGRESELGALRRWRDRPASADFVNDKVLVLHGVGGMGKSTIVASFLSELFERNESGDIECIWAYIDLDRPVFRDGLSGDILDAMVEQFATQLPDSNRLIRNLVQQTRQPEHSEGLESYDRRDLDKERVYHIVDVMRDAGDASFLLVLDTFEELERKHDPEYSFSLAAELIETLHSLSSSMPGFCVLISGRSRIDSLLPVPEEHVIAVDDLDDEAAGKLLSLFVSAENPEIGALPPALVSDVISRVGGSPLTLKLAAKVLAKEGSDGIRDASRKGAMLDNVCKEFVAGFLYRRVIAHLEPGDPELREPLCDVARAAIAMRIVTAEIVEQVLLPSMEREPDPVLASKVFQLLGAHTSLHQSWDGSTLTLQEDLRKPALAALRYEDADLVYSIHERAIDYFVRNPSLPRSQSEEVYHRLMTNEPPDQLIEKFSAEVVSDLVRSLAELPPETADLVAGERDKVSETLRRNAAARNAEHRIESEADGALRDGEPARARTLLGEIENRLPTSKLHRIESRICEAEGDLSGAIEAQRNDLIASLNAAHPRRSAAAAVRLASLFEQSGQYENAVAAIADAESLELLHGHTALRLELGLRRLNTAERGGLRDGVRNELENKTLMEVVREFGEEKITQDHLLLRLCAAAFGREAPGLIVDALVKTGFPQTGGVAAIEDIVAALATSEGFSKDEATRYEQRFLSKSGFAATDLVDVFLAASRAKDVEVMEAFRRIYLYWDHPRFSSEEAVDGGPVFSAPLNWKHQEVNQLADLVSAAYPKEHQVRRLVDQIDVNPETISWSLRHQDLIRNLIDQSALQNKLGNLLEFAAEDEETTSFHKQFLGYLRQL